MGCILNWSESENPATGSAYHEFTDSDTARHAFYHSTTTSLDMYVDGRSSRITTGVVKNIPYSIAFQYNKATDLLQIYVNGILKTGTRAGTWGTNNLGTNFYFGSRFNLIQPLNGTIFYTFFYNRVLSPSEIKQLYVEPYCFIEPRKIWQVEAVAPPSAKVLVGSVMVVS
jgi:hypothetical protein